MEFAYSITSHILTITHTHQYRYNILTYFAFSPDARPNWRRPYCNDGRRRFRRATREAVNFRGVGRGRAAACLHLAPDHSYQRRTTASALQETAIAVTDY